MHTYEEYRQILELWEQGRKKKRIAIITGINRATVRECIERYETVAGLETFKLKQPGVPKNLQILKAGVFADHDRLFRAYAYILGIYLGDGYISKLPRTYKLRIACDTAYPKLIDEVGEAIQVVSPANKVNLVKARGNCIEVCCYSNYWPDILPQHGKGHKHERVIALHDWQLHIVRAFPLELFRGLYHSDGSRDPNPVKGKDYPRYSFCNESLDIKDIFRHACDNLGLHWTTATGGRTIQIARRRDVAFLDQFIGPKS